DCFPALPPEGMRMTFSRRRALARDDLALMSWDHPMVTETIDSITRQESGNVAIATWNTGAVTARAELKTILSVECFFAFEAIADSVWHADAFFPAQPLRVLLEASGKDLGERFSVERMRRMLAPVSPIKAKAVLKIPPDALRRLLEMARGVAEKEAI